MGRKIRLSLIYTPIKIFSLYKFTKNMLILLYKFGYFVVKFLGEDCVQKFFFF